MKLDSLTTRSRNLLTVLSLTAMLAVAFGLRAWEMGDQIVRGDEAHSIDAAVEFSPIELFTQHEKRAFSVPLTLWNSTLRNTVGLNEWGLRLPVFVSGFMLVVVCWLFAWRHFGPLEGQVIGWIAALSPMCILYSRFARPYGIVALCSITAVWGWMEWRERRSKRWGVTCAMAGGIAIYLHLYAAAAMGVLWGLGLAFEWCQWRKESPGKSHLDGLRKLLPSLGIAMGGLALFLAFFGPSIPSFLEFANQKVNESAVLGETWWEALQFFSGTRSDLALLLWMLVAAHGMVLCWKRNRWLTCIFSSMMAALAVLVQLTAPVHFDWGYVIGRYLIAALPGFFLFTALSLSAAIRGAWSLILPAMGMGGAVTAGLLVAGGLLAGFTATGPLPDLYRSPNSFTAHPGFYVDPSYRLAPEKMPSFYRFLEQLPEKAVIAEVPLVRMWVMTPFHRYQSFHRQPVKAIVAEPIFLEDGIEFKNIIPITKEGPDAGFDPEGLDYVILHPRLLWEITDVFPAPHKVRDAKVEENRAEGRRFKTWPQLVERACKKNRSMLLVYEDEWIRVYANGRENQKRVNDWKTSS